MYQQPQIKIDYELETQASFYDLKNPDEVRRSTARLENLFEKMQTAIQPEVYFEVGAGDASSCLRLHQSLPKSRIIAFEGNPLLAEPVAMNLAEMGGRFDYKAKVIDSHDGDHVFFCDNRDGLSRRTRQEKCNSGMEQGVEKRLKTISFANFCRGERLMQKTRSVRINTHKMLYDILQGMEDMLLHSASLYLTIPSPARSSAEWTPYDLIMTLNEGNFMPVARDFPDAPYYRMIFLNRKYANILSEVNGLR